MRGREAIAQVPRNLQIVARDVAKEPFSVLAELENPDVSL
jgi:hypothetical protein